MGMRSTQKALRKQDLSQGIDNAVENDPEIQENDQLFEERMALIRAELQKSGRKDLDPVLLDISDCYHGMRVLLLEAVVTALEGKDLALKLVEVMKDWLSTDEYLMLKTLIKSMPTLEELEDEFSK